LRPKGSGRKQRLIEDEETRRRGSKTTVAEAKALAQISGDKVAGSAKRLAVRLFLCPRSLKLLFMKRYVGGLGASAFNCLHIGLAGEFAQTQADR
jgi:hypothetical protein